MTVDTEVRVQVARIEGELKGHQQILQDIKDGVSDISRKFDELPDLFLTRREADLLVSQSQDVHSVLSSSIARIEARQIESGFTKIKLSLFNTSKSQRLLLILALLGSASLIVGAFSDPIMAHKIIRTVLGALLGSG